ncbi:MAG: DUF4240 domain-containing protein [Anaerolineales bacterium]
MDIKEFWNLIDKTRTAGNGDAQKQSELLSEELTKLSEKVVIAFDDIFLDLEDNAYMGSLWDAATVIMLWRRKENPYKSYDTGMDYYCQSIRNRFFPYTDNIDRNQ